MRVVAAPEAEENQDRDAPVVMPPSPRYPKAQHPSNRMLVIRCSPHQDAAWVQARELADVIQGDAHPLLHRGVEQAILAHRFGDAGDHLPPRTAAELVR